MAGFSLQNMVETTLRAGFEDLWSKSVLLNMEYF